MTEHAFVYGTLKRGHINHPSIAEAGSVVVGETTTRDEFYMGSHVQGLYPAVIDTPKPVDLMMGKIHGQVVTLNSEVIDTMDFIESNGDYYQRKKVELDGFDVPVWMYFLLPVDNYINQFIHDGIVEMNGVLQWGNAFSFR